MADDAVDFELIEEQKENIEPLREGRSAQALKGLFTMPYDQLKSTQNEERLQIEESLSNLDELDDPIQPFLDYIQWIHINFPSGRSVESGLIQVLERCTSQFRDSSFYKNDPRYLAVWLKYAKYSDNPRDIFVYLLRKDIGRDLAMFYEEYANFLEINNFFTQADEVYQEGLIRQARPHTRLEKRYNEFKIRSTQKIEQDQDSASSAFPSRSALSVKSGSGSLFQSHDEEKSSKKPKSSNKFTTKLEVFQDNDEAASSTAVNLKSGGWDKLGSASYRNKENRMEAQPWTGETLQQDLSAQPTSTSTSKLNKVSVFNDNFSDLSNAPIYKIIETPGKKPEKIDMNFDLLYQENEEFCIQEILAITRGIYKINDPSISRSEPISSSESVHEDISNSKIEVKNFRNRNENGTIHLARSELKRKRSPTVTIFTAEAKDEVYAMFSQDLPKKNEDEEQDNSLYYDYTEHLTQTNFNLGNNFNNFHNLTEKVELKSDIDDIGSSPFIDLIENSSQGSTLDPMDEELKTRLLRSLNPRIETYDGLFLYKNSLRLSNALKKSINNKQAKQVFMEFLKTQSTYNLKSLLGEGGYASVYLAESMNGHFKAIKVQKPPSVWEFYILSQIRQRLRNHSVLNSIVCGEEMHFYEDESYLIMNYIPKGTVLDVVNAFKSIGKNVDECLVIFLTVEILKVVEKLHEIGIMHGDLKPDNCMVRFDPGVLGPYSIHGDNGWDTKGIQLIDFGRSIDVTLFPKNIKFKVNLKTDNQDCPEMRNNDSWTYEADYFGIANIIHTLLFGTFIETLPDKFIGGYKLASPIKRYWQQDLWNPLFETLLNSKTRGELPITNALKSHRLELENWLSIHSVTLINSIKKVEESLKK